MPSSDPTSTRLVVMTSEQHDALIRIYELQPPDVIRQLLVAWDAAPPAGDLAGPHGAIRVAITNAYYDARNAGETMEQAADNARDGVLACLGYANPRNEDHTKETP